MAGNEVVGSSRTKPVKLVRVVWAEGRHVGTYLGRLVRDDDRCLELEVTPGMNIRLDRRLVCRVDEV